MDTGRFETILEDMLQRVVEHGMCRVEHSEAHAHVKSVANGMVLALFAHYQEEDGDGNEVCENIQEVRAAFMLVEVEVAYHHRKPGKLLGYRVCASGLLDLRHGDERIIAGYGQWRFLKSLRILLFAGRTMLEGYAAKAWIVWTFGRSFDGGGVMRFARVSIVVNRRVIQGFGARARIAWIDGRSRVDWRSLFHSLADVLVGEVLVKSEAAEAGTIRTDREDCEDLSVA